VAVVLFVVAGFVTATSGLDLAFAKKITRKAATRVAAKVTSKAAHSIAHKATKATSVAAKATRSTAKFAAKASAKASVTAAKAIAGGEFRLLNIYNSLKATNARLVDSMNNATDGLASWYGGMFHGRLTAMGTRYDMNAMTAAHRTLPLGTWCKVTNEENGKTIVVQVTDRGPYVVNRIMDLSHAAATELGYMNSGTTQIHMDVLGTGYANANEAMAAAGMQKTTPAIAASMTGVSANAENQPIAASSDSFSDIVSTIVTLATGSPVHAVASLFA